MADSFRPYAGAMLEHLHGGPGLVAVARGREWSRNGAPPVPPRP